MEGYKLTPKGYLTFTLLVIAFFFGLTSILSPWTGIRLPLPLPALPTVTVLPAGISPSPALPPSPSASPAPPSSPSPSPPADTPTGNPSSDGFYTVDIPSAGETPMPPASLPDNALQLVFPFAGRDMSEQSGADLRAFLSNIPDAQNQDLVLVIEGQAYADEAPADEAVKALADERMRLVRDDCLAQGAPFDLLPVSSVKDPAASADVVGATVYFIRRTDK